MHGVSIYHLDWASIMRAVELFVLGVVAQSVWTTRRSKKARHVRSSGADKRL